MDTATENLRRDLFEWWDSLTPDSPVVGDPLVAVIRRHQAAAWEEGLNSGVGYAGVMRLNPPPAEPINRYDDERA